MPKRRRETSAAGERRLPWRRGLVAAWHLLVRQGQGRGGPAQAASMDMVVVDDGMASTAWWLAVRPAAAGNGPVVCVCVCLRAAARGWQAQATCRCPFF